jgi:hypothetical protein
VSVIRHQVFDTLRHFRIAPLYFRQVIFWRAACHAKAMLRITTEETGSSVRILLEGKLSGAWCAELERLCFVNQAAEGAKPLVVDLKGLTGIDMAGRYLLILLQKQCVSLENVDPLLPPLDWGLFPRI